MRLQSTLSALYFLTQIQCFLLSLLLETLKHCNSALREELDIILSEKSFVESAVSMWTEYLSEREQI